MVKLAPILKEITKDLGVGRHDGSGTDDGKLHEVLTLSPRGWDRAEEYHTDVRNGKIQQPRTIERASDSLQTKWTFDLSIHRAASGRHISEANANRFALSPQVHCTKPFDNLCQQASIRQR